MPLTVRRHTVLPAMSKLVLLHLSWTFATSVAELSASMPSPPQWLLAASVADLLHLGADAVVVLRIRSRIVQ